MTEIISSFPSDDSNDTLNLSLASLNLKWETAWAIDEDSNKLKQLPDQHCTYSIGSLRPNVNEGLNVATSPPSGISVPVLSVKSIANVVDTHCENLKHFCSYTELQMLDEIANGGYFCAFTQAKQICSCNIEFIFDSGCTEHFVPLSTILTSYTSLVGNNLRVLLGDQSKVLDIVGKGYANILGEAYHVPSLTYGLLSVSVFDKLGWSTILADGKVDVLDTLGHIVLADTLRKNLYFLDRTFRELICDCVNHYTHQVQTDTPIIPTDERARTRIKAIPSDENLLWHLHCRLGHLSEGRIKLGLQKSLFKFNDITYNDVKDLKLPLCETCMKGRMKAFPRLITTHHSWKVFQKISCDYKGPFRVRSYHKFTGFFIFSDYTSDFTWTYLCRNKYEILDAIKEFYVRFIIPRKDTQISVFQCDSEMIFVSDKLRSWLKDKNIVLSLASSYRHDMNGQVEADVARVLDKS